ncbi:hypothetical protein AVEN_103633-1 [Araneus ventricosus]|uniref:Uncharacterized protein n=1 Tax=Araneus ventricosus TaxID=182803 RepID=A0A4Y2HBI3_ARAVE|nr:hypothetical protein AVEN_103633-1 [Araneus ventricosus]
MDLVILNRGHMTRTTPELAPPSAYPRTTPTGLRLSHVRFKVHQAHKHGRPSVEPDFEHGALQFRSRDLTIKPPRP